MENDIKVDVVIAGVGVAGLFTAIHLPMDTKVLMICKEDMESCDSMLAQGGICVLRDADDYDAFLRIPCGLVIMRIARKVWIL